MDDGFIGLCGYRVYKLLKVARKVVSNDNKSRRTTARSCYKTKGIAWVYLCLNERIKTEEYAEPGEQSKTHTYYEYDGTQFHAPVESLNLQDINNNPQKYDGYEPAKIPSDIERIDAQVTYTAMMTNTLLTEE